LSNGQHYGGELTATAPCGTIASGENLLGLRLLERDPRLDPFISLMSAELTVPRRA